MASIIKRCHCPDWDECPHPWVVRYRTDGGRASRQREQSFGDDLKEAGNFLLKVEHDKKAHVFIDPDAGKAVFRAEAEAWLAQRIGADSSDMTYKSVLRTHVYPAIGHRQIRTIRREEIKEIIAMMSRKGLSPSRIAQAHLVINAVFNEAVRNKKLPESPCTDIPVPDVVHAADFVFPEDDELEALAAGLPADWATTVWLMYGCGLRIGEALAIKTRSRISQGTSLRVREQVNPVAQLKPLKFRVEGQFRDIPLPVYVSEAIDKHIVGHGTTDDGYLFQGRRSDRPLTCVNCPYRQDLHHLRGHQRDTADDHRKSRHRARRSLACSVSVPSGCSCSVAGERSGTEGRGRLLIRRNRSSITAREQSWEHGSRWA